MFLTVLLAASLVVVEDEPAIRETVLAAWFNEFHGGTGVAFPEQRRPILVHESTIAPRKETMTVRVSSPANSGPASKFNALGKSGIIGDLIERSRRRVAIGQPPARYASGTVKFNGCGAQVDYKRYTDSVAISRPGYSPNGAQALVYLETAGAAYAYLLQRTGSGWAVEWRVELWACG